MPTKKHGVPRQLETSKRFERQHAANVKAQLRSFAKQEYLTKKPKELRILRLKPQVVFKRGSMLPHLFITALQQTVYVVYLDYGEEIRFYFFDIDGHSRGASTFSIGERGLQELHGKAKTLLKLPKLDPDRQNDPKTRAVLKTYGQLLRALAHQYHVTIPDFPVFSALKLFSLKNSNLSSVRWGIRQEQHISYIHPTVIDSRVILRREIFVNLLRLDANNDSNHLMGTLWALAESPSAEIQQFLAQIPPQKVGKTALHRKSFEWIRKKLKHRLITNQPFARVYAQFIFQSISGIKKCTGVEARQISEFFPLWMMNDNFQSQTKWVGIPDSFHGVWIIHELLSFIFSKPDLIHSYKMQGFVEGTPGRKRSWWILYLGSHFILHSHDLLPHAAPPFQAEPWTEDMMSPLSMISAIKTKKYFEFIKGLPSPLEVFEISMLSRMIKDVFRTKALEIEFDPILPILIHHNHLVPISLKNTSDLILYDVEFSVTAYPSQNLSVKIENPPRSTIFDTTLQFVLNISGRKATTKDKGKVTLTCHFRPWFSQTKQEKMILHEFAVTIQD